MNEKLMELVFILDKSGSMVGLEEDVVGGYNSMLDQQKQTGFEVCVSTLTFNSETTVVHDRVNIKDIAPLTIGTFRVGGSTALLDAIGGAIHHIGNVHKYARNEDKPVKTLFVIMTDGKENASYHYSYRQVKSMIERQQKRYNWEFLFLGANIDVAQESAKIGIRRDRMTSWDASREGVRDVLDVMSMAICDFERGDSENLSERIRQRNMKKRDL